LSEADIARAIANARSYVTANPSEARYRDGAATATIEDGLRVRVTGPDGASVVTDMVTGIGGGGSAPSPGWLLRAAHASCVATLIAMRAAEEGWTLSSLDVSVDSESDDRGILGISPDVPAGPLSLRVLVTLAVDGVADEALRTASEEAVRQCPVHDAVVRPVRVEIEIRSS
jgi:uncharacterized OsmC-like protein